MITVTLTWSEMKFGADVGVMRRVSAIVRDRKEFYGQPEINEYDRDVLGAQSELAVAKGLNLFWSGALGDTKAKDVGGFIQVRANKKRHHRLTLHPSDDDGDPFVCVFCQAPRFHLLGWVWASAGKLTDYWKDGLPNRPAFWVPLEKLEPAETLHQLVSARLRAAQ
jgi:hypothetical protein